MKLLIIYHCGLSGDVKASYREYVGQGIDLAVIVPSKIILQLPHTSSGGYFYGSKDDESGYRFFPVDLRKPQSYGEGFKFFQLFKTIKKINPDVIHVYDEYSSFYLAQVIICRNILYGHPSKTGILAKPKILASLRKDTAWRGKKVPIVCYAAQNIQNKILPPSFIFDSLGHFLKRTLRKIIQPIALFLNKKYLDGVTGISTEPLEIIKKIGARMPMRRIFYGVDFGVFYPKSRNVYREKLGIPKDIKLIGNIGRFNEEKGLQNLIKATSQLDKYYLMLLGSGTYEPTLQNIIDSLGLRKRFFHFKNIDRQDLANYYNVLDVFVLPSLTTLDWKEQYGRVLVEAMACGLTIVGSSSGAISEVLEGYPKSLIFKEDDVKDLIEKIKEAENLKFPENFNLDEFLYKFGVENFVREHIKFYNELLK
ncbi:MAG: glycosyltransferase [Candidatus Staskawiczbacteria bacterium]|nr:glycosyltransferase [Candidatus Staskawiczbacteria bacterium]